MEDEEIKRDCEQCKFWDFLRDAGPESLKGEVVGECHRYAPKPHYGFSTDRGIHWPETFAYQWCGEFAPLSEAGHARPA